jgi:hypothetical protein
MYGSIPYGVAPFGAGAAGVRVGGGATLTATAAIAAGVPDPGRTVVVAAAGFPDPRRTTVTTADPTR